MSKKAITQVAVLMGGDSSEREVSLQSGQAVLQALLRMGINAQAFDTAHTTCQELAAFDCAFIALHGSGGEDGVIQGYLEKMKIPYTGSKVLGSALGMDKWRTKLVWQSLGVSTPSFQIMSDVEQAPAIMAKLGLPLFVKPLYEGSSIGISKVSNKDDFIPAYALARQYSGLVLVEQGIVGEEYSVGLLWRQGELQALPIVRISTQTGFYNFEAKYVRNDTQYFCPSGLDKAMEHELQQQAIKAFMAIGGVGWGRVDLILSREGIPYFIEVNTVPGLTNHSLVPKAALAMGLDFDHLIQCILDTAYVA